MQPSPSPADDTALVEKLKAGDEATFAWLMNTYHRPLKRLARSFVASEDVAEEVVQETWVAVLEGLERFEGRSSLKTWIFRILSNRAKTRGVREHRSVPLSALESEGEARVVDANRFHPNGHWASPPRHWENEMPDRLLMNQQAVRHLQAALAALPPAQCAVVTLRDIEDIDAEEVCNLLGISEGNQRVLLHRARSALRASLESFVERS